MNSEQETFFLSKEHAQNRYNICKGCKFLLPTSICQKCGCFMKFKVKLKSSTCPINKW